MIQEKKAAVIPGIGSLVLILAIMVLGGLGAVAFGMGNLPILAVISFFIGFVALIGGAMGLIIVNPNQAVVLQLFGTYVGTVKGQGFWWVNPFTSKRRISQRVRNFESGKLKVNDKEGNPIEIAAVVVWNVIDTAEAIFMVEDFENFVHVQSESALRNLSTSFPYDAHQEGKTSLRGNTAEVADELKREIQERLAKAGVEVVEARISHLAYAPEIAGAMLRRQQANAIIAARQRIVEGAVGMVEMALDKLEKGGKVKLDEERKAAMVSNLLVVLTSDRDAQPIVNAGTLY